LPASSPAEIERVRREATAKGQAQHDALMDLAGWPQIEYDGDLLVSHQDALLLGGKVQARRQMRPCHLADPDTCLACREKTCIEACSGQAITTNPEGGVPLFDREKCVHCGACLWNCSKPSKADPEQTNVRFAAGAGGLHSAEN
jgi:electron-transferring-flavoprotein dehydrogenase